MCGPILTALRQGLRSPAGLRKMLPLLTVDRGFRLMREAGVSREDLTHNALYEMVGWLRERAVGEDAAGLDATESGLGGHPVVRIHERNEFVAILRAAPPGTLPRLPCSSDATITSASTQFADLGGGVRSRLKCTAVAVALVIVIGWGWEMDE